MKRAGERHLEAAVEWWFESLTPAEVLDVLDGDITAATPFLTLCEQAFNREVLMRRVGQE